MANIIRGRGAALALIPFPYQWHLMLLRLAVRLQGLRLRA